MSMQHIQHICMFVCLASPLQGLISTKSKKNGFQFRKSFSSKYSSRTKVDRDLEFSCGRGEFYLDYHGVVRFCNRGTVNRAIDKENVYQNF